MAAHARKATSLARAPSIQSALVAGTTDLHSAPTNVPGRPHDLAGRVRADLDVPDASYSRT